jgi:hypothetical protein
MLGRGLPQKLRGEKPNLVASAGGALHDALRPSRLRYQRETASRIGRLMEGVRR